MHIIIMTYMILKIKILIYFYYKKVKKEKKYKNIILCG